MTETPRVPDVISPRPNGAGHWYDGLSFRLFLLTLGSILIVEAFIFVPSASGFRNAWLKERVQAARIASMAIDAAPGRAVSMELSDQLLMSAEVLAVAEIDDNLRYQLLPPAMPLDGSMHYLDLRETTAMGRSGEAMGAFFAPDDRILIITAEGASADRIIEVVVPHRPLKQALQAFAWRIAGLSLIIGLAAASIIFLLLRWLVVQPMRRVTLSVEQFRKDPGSWSRRLPPTARRDEIGRAQNALSDMETAVADSFRQREHLAELGTAVAKINHDLRNSLASAQLVSDSLSRSEDQRVQKAAPRLERALTRAITLATETLDYGKAKPQAAHPERLYLHPALEEAAAEALSAWPSVAFDNAVDPMLQVMADPDHLHRIAANLIRNAAEAMAAAGSVPSRIMISGDETAIEFFDSGPGLPDSALANLFKPFAGSSRTSGSGLGLAIARELARAMGGDLELAETGPEGTVLRLSFAQIAP